LASLRAGYAAPYSTSARSLRALRIFLDKDDA